MDRLVDEADCLVDSSGSICSSSSGRIESADQQINILNSITASDLSGELFKTIYNAPYFFFIYLIVFLNSINRAF